MSPADPFRARVAKTRLPFRRIRSRVRSSDDGVARERRTMPASLTLEEAEAVLAAAKAKAEEIGQPMNIAVCDDGGHLV
ncbi:heme-binding protein, partial [Streptomyces rhizosphaericus]|uniref:heme-binding protein n=1 Tax=Streptomyces rhizosphaericus TaxID=114699 RepID=UPI003CD0B701